MDPITREEMYLAAAAGYAVEPPEPITRKEVFLAKLAGMDVETPAPFTRRERFIEEAAMAENNAVIEPLQVTENGTYTAPAGVDGYNPVTVDVAGSGGGFPAGLYWTFGDYATPNQYEQTWFTYKGELYAITGAYENAGNTINVYKLSAGKWVAVISSGTVAGFSQSASWSYIEYGEVIHMIGRSTWHYVFDGTTITEKNKIPQAVSDGAAFIQDGKLKAYAYSDGNVYAWDDNTDTWTIEANINSSSDYLMFISDGANAYCTYKKNLHKYENGALTLIGTYESGIKPKILFNSKFYAAYEESYSTNNIYRTKWYKINPQNDAVEFIGYGPKRAIDIRTVVWNNQILVIFGGWKEKMNVAVMHEVSE